MIKGRSAWQTRFGFYMVAIGSAFGLGNLWRFPYVVGSNGGGAFVILYIFFALILGLPLLIAELMLGKISRQSAVGAFESAHTSSRYRGVSSFVGKWVGRLSVLASIVLFSYYSVISGWVLFFVVQFLLNFSREQPLKMVHVFESLMDNGLLQLVLTGFHIMLTIFIVGKGVRRGIEKWIGFIMPMFGMLMVVLVFQSLRLPGTTDALRFLFYPNFSKFTSTTLIHVIGHIFFTLSIGMGAMITFGSYLRPAVHIPTEGFRVTALDTVLSLFAGLIIFPIIFSGGVEMVGGPTTLFETLPVLFGKMGLGSLFGVAFFLCLYMAALGASIGLLESSVSNLMDRRHAPRGRASWIMGIVAFGLSLFPALSSTYFRDVNYNGMGGLALVDASLINWILPVAALGVSITAGYFLNSDSRKAEFISTSSLASVKLYSNWLFVIKFLAPILILVAIGLNLAASFRN